ncbi:hypothetical protein L4A40_26825 [Bacillus cereus]|uniref:hypothetical protein n=1 Tax=Bacillus cereus TaxID=1396 RepID=UPI001F0D6754|nr:hypothetical protein [Bacillus cereus]MCH5476701.1 hypothetical protein [Bacillus cereus]
MTTYEHKLEAVMQKQHEIERELNELRRATYKSQRAAERAHERISVLEKQMETINAMLLDLSKSVIIHGEKIDSFDRKQDSFLANQQQTIRWLVLIAGGILTVLGGLVGIKLTFPL